MQNNKENDKSIRNKLATVKYNCDSESHLVVNQQKCSKCKDKVCTYICPAGVYSIDENTGEIMVQYENCLECGACKVACPKNSIDWNYPKAGCGVILKNN